MIIEDEELRQLYKTSSSEHLQRLEADLMILEKNPQDTVAIEEFLREAHTLKGDSRMLGLDEIEMLVHHLEDCVEGIKAGRGEITPQLCDRLYQGIDAINQLSHQAITGEAVDVNTLEVLASLSASSDNSSTGNLEADLFSDEPDLLVDTSNSEADLFDDANEQANLFDDRDDLQQSLFDEDPEILVESITKTSVTPNHQQHSQTPVANQNYKIDTIRVEPQKLDILLTQASELAVTKLRISQQMAEIDQMLTLSEGWSQHKFDSAIIDQIEQYLSPEQFKPFKYFLNNTHQSLSSLNSLVSNLKIRAAEDIASLEIISDRLESGIQDLRQLPLSTVFNIYPRMVRDLARQQSKEIELVIEGGDTKVDKRILEEIKDPLLHLLRNAIDHGIETPSERISRHKPGVATITLRGYQTGNSIGIEISDDGRGLDLTSISNTAIKRQVRTPAELAAMSESEIQSLIFASGFSTRTEITQLSGRGIGLDVVRANVERLKGSIQVNSIPGNGCKFQILLNPSLTTTKVLIVEVDQVLYALPLEFVQTMITLSPKDIYEIEGKTTITFEERPVSVVQLASLLQLPTNSDRSNNNYFSCIILQVDHNYFGVMVDDLVDQQDVVLKPQSKLLKRIPNIAGATILGSGEVCMILNPSDLLHSLGSNSWQSVASPVVSVDTSPQLLLVEDSIIIRTQMQRLLKAAGYKVTVAENGLAGWQQVQTHNFDIVLSDVEMPQMNGLEMTAEIRRHSEYDRLPIVLITTLASPEDKRRGANAGANAYLTKGDFEQQLLFQTLERLINAQQP